MLYVRVCLPQVVAAGPYTTSDNWEYEPLEALLEYTQGVAPDVLLLVHLRTTWPSPQCV